MPGIFVSLALLFAMIGFDITGTVIANSQIYYSPKSYWSQIERNPNETT